MLDSNDRAVIHATGRFGQLCPSIPVIHRLPPISCLPFIEKCERVLGLGHSERRSDWLRKELFQRADREFVVAYHNAVFAPQPKSDGLILGPCHGIVKRRAFLDR